MGLEWRKSAAIASMKNSRRKEEVASSSLSGNGVSFKQKQQCYMSRNSWRSGWSGFWYLYAVRTGFFFFRQHLDIETHFQSSSHPPCLKIWKQFGKVKLSLEQPKEWVGRSGRRLGYARYAPLHVLFIQPSATWHRLARLRCSRKIAISLDERLGNGV